MLYIKKLNFSFAKKTDRNTFWIKIKKIPENNFLKKITIGEFGDTFLDIYFLPAVRLHMHG